jgi:hypothetical protein
LTPEERKQQWLKYKALGKFVYGLSFLDLEDDYKEWAQELAKREAGETVTKH